MLIAASLRLAGALVFVGVRPAWSPGKLEAFLGENGNPLSGSVSEKVRVTVVW